MNERTKPVSEKGTVPTMGHAVAGPTVPGSATILRMVPGAKLGMSASVLSAGSLFADFEPVAGFHPAESDELGTFVWTQATFQARLKRRGRFARIELCYHGTQGVLSVGSEHRPADTIELCRGWQTCVVRLENVAAGELVEWRVAPIVPVAGESRVLGIMVRQVELTDDPRAAEALIASQRNLWLNQQELAAGTARLESVPPHLRINLEARCNIPESSQACAYCAWDWAKASEVGSPAFRARSLDDLGEFYAKAVEINDCSIGEPTMNKDFGRIVARVDDDGKRLSLTTNGQLLGLKRRREVLGRNLSLYVSIDSATAEGYARYRNDRFDDLIANLRTLCRDKRRHGGLPRVFASFIAMRSNVEELPGYFALMGEIGVDQVKLRSLYLDENLEPLAVNNGYVFDYRAELLSFDELAAVGNTARELASRHGVALYIEWEQFAAEQATGGLACSEPWKTLYVLRRGIMPCCYATRPLATWDQQRGRPLDEFLRDVYNGPAYQGIRRELAAGRLAAYCLNTPSCPILKDQLQRDSTGIPLNSLQQQMMAASCGDESSRLPMVPLESLTAGSIHAR